MVQERVFWPDLVRCFAIFLVVVVHTSSPVVLSFSEVEPRDWLLANAFDSFARVSVPLFFMISGYLVLNKDYNFISNIFRVTKRVLIPLIFWSFFYISYAATEYGLSYFIEYDYLSLLKSPAQYHLWFLYDIFFLYLLIPFMKAFIEKKLVIYFMVFWFSKEFLGFMSVDVYWRFDPISKFAGYMLIGYYIGNIKEISFRIKVSCFIFFFVCFLITFFKTYQLSFEAGEFVKKYYSYRSPNVMIMSICLFILLKDADMRSCVMKTFITTTSKYALGIYGIHVLVIHLLSIGSFGFSISAMGYGGSGLALIVSILSVFIVSFLVVMLLGRIKIVKNILG